MPVVKYHKCVVCGDKLPDEDLNFGESYPKWPCVCRACKECPDCGAKNYSQQIAPGFKFECKACGAEYQDMRRLETALIIKTVVKAVKVLKNHAVRAIGYRIAQQAIDNWLVRHSPLQKLTLGKLRDAYEDDGERGVWRTLASK